MAGARAAAAAAGKVIFKSDSDHDGMLDEDEARNGTDPDDPSDADADADADGEEARLGYSPTDAANTPPASATLVRVEVTPATRPSP